MAGGQGLHPWRSHLIFLLLFAGIVLAAHAPYLDLPFFWDELGYFIPAALDLYQSARWIPASTEANSHPPLVMAYLALTWKLAGYSITAARLAMLLLAGVTVFLAFLLAVQLCRDRPGVPALVAVVFMLASPLIYTQSMMAQLDMPAMLFTTLSLLLFLRGSHAGAALACTALVLTKETGVVVPLVFLLWLAKGGLRSAAWFLLPLAALSAWFVLVWHSTGHLFGSAKFTDYNLLYPAHPFRLAVSLLKRGYGLFVADFHWVGTAAIFAAR
ncbi:MAG: glycosyltransferase family 39 protein, partial [Acidobacteriia bacterium]|nr:glycosyltransferase family 39 protein [Terriglobia bacterium]